MDNTPQTQTLQDKIDFFLLSAHELRTSLSAMKWLFKMLSDGDFGTLTEEQLNAITQASQANNRMVDLLNSTMTAIKNDDVITYAKIAVNLTGLVNEIAQEFTSEAKEHQITITYHQPSTDIIVCGDVTKLRIALHNIVENAIKYSNSNTEID
ncbi:MAG: multi-sensor signal transduction histidine kinase, partial [Candidatus Nomurabacteria bacterium]|nr:multi-sensor signal transduction histidine kinase [Candidatus Nomurabacteria bacterium]